MKLVVEILTGTLFLVEVADDCTAAGLKEVIAAQEELPRDRLIFVLDDGEWYQPILYSEDEVPLAKLGFGHGSHVYLLFMPVDKDDASEILKQDGRDTVPPPQ